MSTYQCCQLSNLFFRKISFVFIMTLNPTVIQKKGNPVAFPLSNDVDTQNIEAFFALQIFNDMYSCAKKSDICKPC